MPTIVDANILSIFFSDLNFKAVVDALRAGKASLAYGGSKQLREYGLLARHLPPILELQRQGKANRLDSSTVDLEEEKVKKRGYCVSDDEHIIAIALVSGARLLCSRDQNLIEDFTNPKIIGKPRGKVYKNTKHKRLIAKHGK